MPQIRAPQPASLKLDRRPSADVLANTTEASNAKLATQLVAWDIARRSAEAKLLTVPLPGIAVREEPIPDDPTLANASPTASGSVVAVPRMSPHFTSVQMDWPAICERRGALPDDVFNYAMAWCRYARAGKGDLEDVLIGLTSSTVPGMRDAALVDLVNVIADAHDAVTAMRILDKVTTPPGALERLASTYNALGRADDAATVRNRLPPPKQSPAPPKECSELRAALQDFVPESLVTIRGVADGSSKCSTLARSLLCRIAAVSANAFDGTVCARSASSAPQSDAEAQFLAAYSFWGTDWSAVVDHAEKAMPEPGAEQVAVAALTASLRTGCQQSRLEEVQQRAKRLLLDPSHEARWTPTLQTLTSITQRTCDGLQTAIAP